MAEGGKIKLTVQVESEYSRNLIERLVTVANEQLPYDYEQGLCAWCRVGFIGNAAFGSKEVPPSPHAEDCPYAEALEWLRI